MDYFWSRLLQHDVFCVFFDLTKVVIFDALIATSDELSNYMLLELLSLCFSYKLK